MSQHTPGPWTWDEVPLTGLGHDRWCEVLNSNSGPAVLRHEASGGLTPWRIRPEDARLIAAAPELLEALKIALEEMTDPEIEGALLIAANHGYVGTEAGRNLHGKRRAIVRAAIAKAEGR